jgi:hypothetical protein
MEGIVVERLDPVVDAGMRGYSGLSGASKTGVKARSAAMAIESGGAQTSDGNDIDELDDHLL